MDAKRVDEITEILVYTCDKWGEDEAIRAGGAFFSSFPEYPEALENMLRHSGRIPADRPDA